MRNKRVLWAAAALTLVAILMACAYFLFAPKGAAGSKTITVEIVNGDSRKSFVIATEEAYLRGALEGEGLIAGEESAYGLFVKTVDGYTVDDGRQEWWRLTKNGQTMTVGVDAAPIADGERYELTMMVGY